MVQTLWDSITEFLSPEAGQRRRAALDEFGRDVGYYVPPEMRGLLGFAAEMTPSATIDRAAQAGAPGLLDLTLGYTPFDATMHEPQDVGLGGPSTEYVMTERSPDGEFWNVPSIWWGPSGDPVLLEDRGAVQFMARQYEASSGKRFPRFKNPYSGAAQAMHRSEKGGGKSGPLAK